MIGGIRASSLGQGGIDQFPPHPLHRRHVRRGLLLQCPQQFFQDYGAAQRPESATRSPTPRGPLILRFQAQVGPHQLHGVPTRLGLSFQAASAWFLNDDEFRWT